METNEKIAMKVSKNTIIVNVVLSLIKFIAGIIAHSGAMISDAIHSASDVFSTIIVMIGIKIANKEPDKEHQYGHERLECIAAILLSVILAITGGVVGLDGLNKIINNDYESLAIPGVLALIAAIISIIIKEGMYWYTIINAKKINSPSLMADAWHHRSDAFSSIGALIGIVGARLGFPVLDPIASIVICFFIFRAVIEIFMDATKKLIDEAADEEVVEEITNFILKQDGVIDIDLIRTRKFGAKLYVDVEILVDGNLTLFASHEIAENVHDKLEEKFSEVKHCMIHINPYIKEEKEE